MNAAPPTIIIRHTRERLSKCSLHGLESREDLIFRTFHPDRATPLTSEETLGRIVLSLDAPPLSADDAAHSLILIDGTWRLAEKMHRAMRAELRHAIPRSLPTGWRTAYPRVQTACPDPDRGLASVEALFVAHHVMGRSTDGLMDHYHWRDAFLTINAAQMA